MDISATIARLKENKNFAENVGMVLVHNGVVRGWSRGDHSQVSKVEVSVDQLKID
ncbi:MAG: molybdenum cofactor biosynthesis protein, partial [Desulfuromonas sp.]